MYLLSQQWNFIIENFKLQTYFEGIPKTFGNDCTHMDIFSYYNKHLSFV